jgi:L-cysteate sulfo-lyase
MQMTDGTATMKEIERVGLGNFPTPFEEMPRLGAELRGPRLFVKRDDMSGLAMGGNKTRQLDYILVDAKKKGADAIITTCGIQSNWSRQTVAAAVRLGMKPSLVLRTAQFKSAPRVLDGNILLDHIMGAEIRIVNMRINEDPQRYLEEEGEKLRKRGFNPYILSLKASVSPQATVAYVECMSELHRQAKKRGIELDAIVVASGAGPTQAGLALGAKNLGLKTRVIGVNVGAYNDEEIRKVMLESSRGAARLVGASAGLLNREIDIREGYAGRGYGIPTKESNEAVFKVARSEGLIIDPVYTSKTIAGLLDMIGREEFSRDENVCFIHTGGTPALFAYKQHFQPGR